MEAVDVTLAHPLQHILLSFLHSFVPKTCLYRIYEDVVHLFQIFCELYIAFVETASKWTTNGPVDGAD